MSLYVSGGAPALEAPRSYSGKPITGISYQGNTTITGTPAPDSPATLTPVEPPAVPGAAKQIGPLWSLPDGTRDTYDGETGMLVRRVGKLVLDGTEDWQTTSKAYYINVPNSAKNYTPLNQTHFGFDIYTLTPGTSVLNEYHNYVVNYDNGVGGVDNFKGWLAAQAAAGTPAIVIYELAQPVVERIVYTGPIATRSTDILAPSWTGKTTVTGTPSPDSPATITGVPFRAIATGPDGQARSVDLGATGYSLPNGAADSYDGVRGDFVQRVGRLILNGTETWTALTSIEKCFRLDPALNNIKPGTQSKMSTHFQIRANLNDFDGFSISNDGNVFLRDKSFTGGVDGLKSWLAAQAAAGTPVTIYYELAEPTAYNRKADLQAFDGQTTITGADVVEVIEGRVLRFGDYLPYQCLHSNRNILINSDFRQPVNQRGLTTYTDGYGIDAWYQSHGRLTIGADGAVTKLENTDPNVDRNCLVQKLEPEKTVGRTWTYSIACSIFVGSVYASVYDGKNVYYSNKISSSGIISVTFSIGQNITPREFRVHFLLSSGGSCTPIAAKLEEGTESTLWIDLLNPPPDPTLELLKCQRYYISPLGNLCVGYITGEDAQIFVPTPITMRANPTVNIIFADNIVTPDGVWNVRSVTRATTYKNGVKLDIKTSRSANAGRTVCTTASTSFSFSAEL